MNIGICGVNDCERTPAARGFCTMHYKRFMKHGDPLVSAYQRRDSVLCRIDGCDRQILAKGLCGGHYQRARNGLPLDSLLAPRYRVTETHKRCSSCHTEKPHADFSTNSGGRVSSWCKECRNYGTKLNLYGLDRDTYQAMVKRGCAVCGATDRIHIDHDHTSGKVRGALCSACNIALGYACDDPERLEKLAAYVRSHAG